MYFIGILTLQYFSLKKYKTKTKTGNNNNNKTQKTNKLQIIH